METKSINWEQDLLYTKEQYQKSKTAEFVTVIGCHIYFQEVATAISLIWLCMHQVSEEKW